MSISKEFQDWINKQSKAKQSKISMLIDFGVSESAIREKMETVKRGAPGREVNVETYGETAVYALLERMAHKTAKVDGKITKGARREMPVIQSLVNNAAKAVSRFSADYLGTVESPKGKK